MRLFSLPHLAILLAATGCASGTKVTLTQTGASGCVSTRSFFETQVWDAFMANDCAGCHNPQGVARSSDMVLQANTTPGNKSGGLSSIGAGASAMTGETSCRP